MALANERFLTPKRIFFLIIGFIGAVLLLCIVSGLSVSVPTGARGVLLRFDRAQSQPLDPGIHFKLPFVDHVVNMPITIQLSKAEAAAVSNDLQQVHTQVQVNYHIDPAKIIDVYSRIGSTISIIEPTIIAPAVQSIAKTVTGRYTAAQLITQRPKVTTEMDDLLKANLATYGLVVDNLSVTDFTFSKAYADAIENKTVAEQDVLTAQQTLEKAKIDAEQNVARAKANAQVITMTAQANADALRLQREQVTPELIDLRRVEVLKAIADKWNGELSQTMMLGQGADALFNVGSVPSAGAAPRTHASTTAVPSSSTPRAAASSPQTAADSAVASQDAAALCADCAP